MMMWSNFFMQEEDRRRAGRRRAQGQQGVLLTPEREGKIKLVLLLAAVGATLAVLAVGTEFWVELNTYKTNGSAVCDAAHLGLWKVCTKRLWQADVPEDRETCGPAELPGEANCTYFKFFTTGKNVHIFQRTTKKGWLASLICGCPIFGEHGGRVKVGDLVFQTLCLMALTFCFTFTMGCVTLDKLQSPSVNSTVTSHKQVNTAAAAIAVLGLVAMALGCLCIIMVLSKGAEFLLRLGAVCFGLSGLLLLVSLEVFRHSVRALLKRASPGPPPAPRLTYEYSWSLACGVAAGLILLLGGGCFLWLTLPSRPWGSLCPKRGHPAA